MSPPSEGAREQRGGPGTKLLHTLDMQLGPLRARSGTRPVELGGDVRDGWAVIVGLWLGRGVVIVLALARSIGR